MIRVGTRLIAAAVAVISLGCGSTKLTTVPTSRAPLEAPALDGVEPRPLPWRPLVRPGEYALYDLKVRGLVVGEIELATGQPGLIDGAVAHYVVMRGTAAGIPRMFVEAEMKMTAEISSDPDRPRTTTGTLWARFRGKEKTDKKDTRMPAGRHNPITAMIALRGWRPEPGEVATLTVGKGSGTELVLVAQSGKIRGPFRRPARRLAGIARSRSKSAPFEVWISDDRDRVPLLVRFATKYGDVTLELVGYRRPRR